MRMEIVKDGRTFHPSEKFESILRHAFEVYSRELGWGNGGPTVEVRFRPLSRSTGGQTDATALRPFKVDMQITEPSVAIYNFAHELVHVDQLERGDLMLDEVQQKSYWKGMAIERHDQFAVETPPEVEAYSRGPELYRVLVNELSREEMVYLLNNVTQNDKTGPASYENFEGMTKKIARERSDLQVLLDEMKQIMRGRRGE